MNLLLSWATAARARFQRAPSPDPSHNPGQPTENKGNGDLQNGKGGDRSFAPATSPPAPDSEVLRARARLRPGVARGKLKPFRPDQLAGIAMAAVLVDGKR